MVTSASQRSIPDDIVYPPPSLPEDLEAGAVFPFDKPRGASSFDIVRRVRQAVQIKKVGHAGTLDPMATGLLLVLVARPATRLQDAFMSLRKTYTGTMRLGETTPSYDAETDVTDRADASHLTLDDVRGAAAEFEGTINQIPPMYSAVKVDGERLYEKARRGETIQRAPRQVSVYSFAITDLSGADAAFRIECSKGTYVRSLARDVGDALGVGAHLTALRRTRIGPYNADDAWSPSAFEDAVSSL